jgi:hypothetical protein
LNDRFFDVKMIDEEDFTLENIKWVKVNIGSRNGFRLDK